MDDNENDNSSRLFTVEEANTLIPVIHPKVMRMQEAIVRARAHMESTRARKRRGARRMALPVGDEAGVTALVAEARTLIAEIHAYGCLVNGPEAGLIDFPALLGSELVYLCWKVGEPQVSHWHRIADGFAGRRPLLDARADKGWIH